MLQYKTGNIFLSNADCLINTVNCEGYMGKGIAYQFKTKFPQNNINYIEACKNGVLHIGALYSYREGDVTIINFPTKNKWREKSRMSYIETGLDEMVKLLPQLSVKSVAIPPLGCGNGGLVWTDVKKMIQEKLSSIEEEYDFLIYEPSSNSSQTLVAEPKLKEDSLLLMKIRVELDKFTMQRLQAAAFLLNIYAQKKYYKFERSNDVPHSRSIDFACQKIREYQAHYGLKDTKSTYQSVYNVICSEKVTGNIEAATAHLKKATDFINAHKDDAELDELMRVLLLIEKNNGISLDNIINSSFVNTDPQEYLSQLEAAKLIEKDIFENYHTIGNIPVE